MKSARTRIKVCGMTSAEQAAQAVALGVDSIGMIIHANSPRRIDLELAKAIRRVTPAFVQLVGVSVNAEIEHARYLATEIGLDLLQLHGEEDDDYANSLKFPYIRAIRARSQQYVEAQLERFESGRGFLLDPYVEGQHGGTGHVLSQDCWPSKQIEKPLILAGGLSVNNLFERIQTLKPYAVDLNSGVEIGPGNKDMSLLAQAIAQVRRADSAQAS